MLKAVAPAMMTEVVMVEVVDNEVAVAEEVVMAAARETVAGLAASKAVVAVEATREVAMEAAAARETMAGLAALKAVVAVVATREVAMEAAAARETVAALTALKAVVMVAATREGATEAAAASVADSQEEPDSVMATEARVVVTVVEKQALVAMLVEEGR